MTATITPAVAAAEVAVGAQWRTLFCRCAAVKAVILQGIKRCQFNSTREDSQTESVCMAGKCWCSELYKLMNCQCFVKTQVCYVLRVLQRVGGAGQGACGQ